MCLGHTKVKVVKIDKIQKVHAPKFQWRVLSEVCEALQASATGHTKLTNASQIYKHINKVSCNLRKVLNSNEALILYPREVRGFPYQSSEEESIAETEDMGFHIFLNVVFTSENMSNTECV